MFYDTDLLAFRIGDVINMGGFKLLSFEVILFCSNK
jgi:hypothetical protein